MPRDCLGQRATYTTASQIARELLVKSSSMGTILLIIIVLLLLGALPMGTILLIIIVLLLLGALPHWPYSSGWGYYPSGGLGLVLLIIIILLAFRYI